MISMMSLITISNYCGNAALVSKQSWGDLRLETFIHLGIGGSGWKIGVLCLWTREVTKVTHHAQWVEADGGQTGPGGWLSTHGVLIMMTRRDDVVRVKVGFNADNPHASPIFTVVQRRLEVTDFPLLKSLQTHSRWTPCSTPCTSPITSRWLSSTRQIISAFLWEHRWLTCNSLRYL